VAKALDHPVNLGLIPAGQLSHWWHQEEHLMFTGTAWSSLACTQN